jgi:hypothetical protein
MPGPIRYLEKRTAWTASGGPATATAEPEPRAQAEGKEEVITLPVPEHLHQLWLALGLDDE